MTKPIIKKKSILKNSTSTPVVYSDGTLDASTLENATWSLFADEPQVPTASSCRDRLTEGHRNRIVSLANLFDDDLQPRNRFPEPARTNGACLGPTSSIYQGRCGNHLTMQMADLSGVDLDLLRGTITAGVPTEICTDLGYEGFVPVGPPKQRNKVMEIAERRLSGDFLSRSSYQNIEDDLESDGEEGHIFKIPTGAPMSNRARVLDAAKLSNDDLTLLKKKDPFMYFSLPGATEASLMDKDLDVLSIKRTLTAEKLTKQEQAFQNRNVHFSQTNESWGLPNDIRRVKTDSNLHVKRQTRITYENHFGIMLEEMIKEQQETSVHRPSTVWSDDEDEVMEDFTNPAEN